MVALPTFSSRDETGELLARTARLFYAAWPKLMLTMGAVALANAALLALVLLAARLLSGALTPEQAIVVVGFGGQAATIVLPVLGSLAGIGVVSTIAAGAMTGAPRRRSLLNGLSGQVWRRAIGRLPALFGAFVLFVLVIAAAASVAVVSVIGARFTLAIAAVGIVAWLVKPQVRHPALRWLILALVPFAAAVLLIARLSLWPQAVAIGGTGPVGALRRSYALTAGRWWVVALVLAAAALATAAFQTVTVVVIGLVTLAAWGEPLDITAATVSATGIAPLAGVLFGAIPAVTGTVLYLRLNDAT